MKARRAIYAILGSLFIVINILVDITVPDKPQEAGDAYSIGYFIGSHFMIILGLIFLIMAFNVNKKIRNVRDNEIENDIKDMGKQ